MRRVLLCTLEAVEGEVYFVEVLEVMRCELISILEAVEGGLRLLEVLEMLVVPEVMHRVLLCLLEVHDRPGPHRGSVLVRVWSRRDPPPQYPSQLLRRFFLVVAKSPGFYFPALLRESKSVNRVGGVRGVQGVRGAQCARCAGGDAM